MKEELYTCNTWNWCKKNCIHVKLGIGESTIIHMLKMELVNEELYTCNSLNWCKKHCSHLTFGIGVRRIVHM